MKSRYIFIDIDGTLLDHRTGIPESSFYAIRQARENGNKVFICTGRAKSEISSHILDIGFDGFVYSSGAVVEVHGQQLLMAQIDSSDIEVLIPHMEKRKISLQVC
jgi:HAD superfamily hydrolase (TIGR01484 family)